jgi:putative ABC transport system ATP-binding protein
MPPLIEARDLVKTYLAGDLAVPALRGVGLRIDPGEFVALIGPSGSGKSTLMYILGLLDKPTSGTYRLDGVGVEQFGRRELAQIRNEKIGFVFQGFHLLPRKSAWENVALPLVYAGVGLRERRRRADELLERVGLADRRNHRPNELSGGQQQRVAIARALINRPRLLLADEPTGNLDSATGAEVLAEFRRWNRDEQQTIVLVTHDADVANVAERIVSLRDGRIVGDARPAEAATA